MMMSYTGIYIHDNDDATLPPIAAEEKALSAIL